VLFRVGKCDHVNDAGRGGGIMITVNELVVNKALQLSYKVGTQGAEKLNN